MSDASAQGRSPKSLEDDQRIANELAGLDRHTDPFVAAVHATRMPMIITNPRLPDNPVVFANDSFCRLSGYARDEIVGRNCRFLQGPETDPETVKLIHQAVERVEPIEIDIRNHRKDGEPFWNRLLMAPVFDVDQQLAYFFASQVDVTIERERLKGLESDNAALMAELTGRLQAQQERERELDFALRAGRFGTWSLELINMQLTSSDQCKALFGFPADVTFSYDDRVAAIHPDDRDHALSALERTLRTGSEYEVEYRVVWPDGDVHWLATRGQAFTDPNGKPVRLTGVSLDITAVKRAERRRIALADLNDRFRDLDDASDISFVAAETLGRTLEVSRAGYGLVDRTTETITIDRDWNAPGVTTLAGVLAFRDYGSYIEDLKRGDTAVVEDARIDPRTTDTAAALEAINARSFINMPLTEQGGLVALLYVNDGRPRSWSSDDLEFMREIAERTRVATERRRAERELSDLAASLERQVAERTTDLMRAEDALRQSQKMEAVGQLTGGLAHDFNNLLTVIRGSVDLLRRPGLADAKRERYINAIGDTADRAATLTSQLLAFSRRQTLKPEVFDVGRSVAALQPMITTLAGSRISIRLEEPAGRCFIDADRSQFDTALVNLAANARDAMAGQGNLTFSIGTADQMPALRSHPAVDGDFVTISVADNGSGIAADQLERIFEPFFTTKEVGHGTGLGLSQVFGFTKQSGGDVAVTSEVGRGSTFTMFLPAATELGERDDATVDPAAAERPACGRILVVEDNRDVGMFATEALAEMGYDTVWAADGAAALEALAASDASFDMVFSDVVMPGMSGIELGREVRRKYPGLPIILASGYSSVLADEGAHEFALLRKPYSLDDLAETIRQTLEPS